MTEPQKQRAIAAARALLAEGLNPAKLTWVMAQLAFETAHFASTVALVDNNLSGIKYYKQKGATRGTKAPANEGDYYAHYNNYNEWARDYLRILNTVGKQRPLDAASPEDFVRKLKENNYFSGNLTNYIKGVLQLSEYYGKYIIPDLIGTVKKNPIKTSIIVVSILIGAAFIFNNHHD